MKEVRGRLAYASGLPSRPRAGNELIWDGFGFNPFISLVGLKNSIQPNMLFKWLISRIQPNIWDKNELFMYFLVQLIK